MADMNSQATHLTSLNFDLSEINTQFANLQKQIIQQAELATTNFSSHFKIDISSLKSQIDRMNNTKNIKPVNMGDLEKQIANIGNLTKAQISQLSSLYYKEAIKNSSEQQRLDAKVAANKENLANRTSAVVQQLQQKEASNINTINAKAIKEQENMQISHLNRMAELEMKNINEVNRAREMGYAQQQNNMMRLLQSSFRNVLSLAGIYSLRQVLNEFIETLNETEFKVMEISRIMQDLNATTKNITEDIYEYADRYARSFNDAADIYQRFAQAGYDMQEIATGATAAMLALNTAELNASSATQSLIGILKQWNLETSDLLGVVDRINVSADNFAITSQDLVDALLKSGSVAKSANITFEDTIGLLVAMKESSGAAGKEVGNALKSILSYIQRPDSLKAFESLGIEVFADKATQTLRPMMDILTDMANKWNDASTSMQNAFMKAADGAGLMSEELALAIGASDEYNEVMNQYAIANDRANDAESRLQATQAAGVYRKNYYIALMENFGRVQEVVTNLQDADGYSMRENSKYMDTLTAKYQQLVNALQKLAVQAGQNGFNDLAKSALDASTNVVNFINDVGGLETVIVSLIGVLTILKSESIAAFGATFISNIQKAIATLKILYQTTLLDTNSIIAFGRASLALVNPLQAATIAIGAVITAISLYNAAQAKEAQRVKETITNTQEKINTLQEEQKNISQLVLSYKDLSESEKTDPESRERIKEIQTKIKDLVGEQANNLDLVNGKLEEQLGLLSDIQASQRQAALEELETLKNLQERQLQLANKKAPSLYGWTGGIFQGEDIDKFLDATNKWKDYLVQAENGSTRRAFNVTEILDNMTVEEQIETLSQWRSELNSSVETEEYAADALAKVSERLNYLKEVQAAATDATDNFNRAFTSDKIIAFAQSLEDQAIDTVEEFNQLMSTWSEDWGISKEDFQEFATELIPAFSNALTDANGQIDENSVLFNTLSEKFDLLEDDIQKVNAALDTLEDAMGKVAGGQSLTAEKTIELLELYPQLATSLQQTSDGWIFETGAMEAARQAKYNMLIIDQTLIAIEQLTAAGATNEANALLQLVQAAASASDGMINFAQVLNTLNAVQDATIAKSTTLAVALAKLKVLASESAKPVEIQLPKISTSGGGGGGRGGSATKSLVEQEMDNFERLVKFGQKSVQEQINFYRKLQSEAQLSGDERMKVEDKLFSLYKKQINESLDLEKKKHDTQLKNIQEEYKQRIEAEKKRYDSLIKSTKAEWESRIKNTEDYYDSQIDGLKRVEKENDRIREKEEYYAKRKELLHGYQGIEYWSQRTGRDARLAEAEARKKLEDLDREWAEKQEDWNISDRIDQLQKARDKELESLREAMDAELEALEEQKEASIAALEEERDRQVAAVEDLWNKLQEKYTEANINMLAYSATFAPGFYDQYLNDFILPTANGLLEGFEQANDIMNSEAGAYASSMYNQYDQNLVQPLKAAMAGIQENAMSLEDKIKEIGDRLHNSPTYDPYKEAQEDYQHILEMKQNKYKPKLENVSPLNQRISDQHNTTNNSFYNNTNNNNNPATVNVYLNNQINNETDANYLSKKVVGDIKNQLYNRP